MGTLPGALFAVDVNHEKIAVAEAARCGIPCVALVDTNSDPTTVTHPIPGNDDAVKSVCIIVDTMVEAIQKGLAQRDSRRAARGSGDLKSATAAVAAAAIPAVAPVAVIDLEKIELPAKAKEIVGLAEDGVVVDDNAGKLVAKKKPIRAVQKDEVAE
jgi:small subunit ribosomal protein S2